jgi:hypothetical protein
VERVEGEEWGLGEGFGVGDGVVGNRFLFGAQNPVQLFFRNFLPGLTTKTNWTADYADCTDKKFTFRNIFCFLPIRVIRVIRG